MLQEDLEEGDRSIRTALYQWSARVGPVPFITWQSAYHGLKRDHGLIAEDARPDEDFSVKAARIKSLYEEIHVQNHGPDYAERARVVYAERRAERREAGSEKATVSYTHLTLPTKRIV